MIKILIVDDSEADTYLTKEIFDELYIDVEIKDVYNGEEAVKILQTYNPDIILLDIKMPRMDGLETLAYLKKNRPEIIVVMMTTSDLDKDIVTSKNLDADAYIIKPLDPREFEKKIHSINNVFINKEFEFVKFSN